MPVKFANVVECRVVVREETAVQDKVFAAHKSSQGKCGEGFGEYFEDVFVVLGFALSFETVYFVHVVCFVVSSVEEELVWS